MLFRAAWARQAAPLRRQAFAPLARRSVTTDAASSHAENIPQEDDKPFTVRLSDESFETYEIDPPPYDLEVTKKELKQMYYDMVVTRYGLSGEEFIMLLRDSYLTFDGSCFV
jgi:pyruvate dehydrogenase E1 component alpha subunit